MNHNKKEVKMKNTKIDLRFNQIRENIKILSEGLRSLESCGIKTDLLVLMLMDQTKLNRTECQAVLKALSRLEQDYLK